MSAQIITFYSYKGGVARSMALANVAWLLASDGKRVLIMAWNPEAPGLPRFFAPFLDQNSLASSPGLIEWFSKRRSAAVYTRGALPHLTEPPTQDAEVDLLPFTLPVSWSFPPGGCLELVSAGSSAPSYARLLSDFDWEDFYNCHDGYHVIERLRVALRRTYDYVLIDSRTGVSDTRGICTIQLPDAVVICSTLNWQSLNGASRIAEAAPSTLDGWLLSLARTGAAATSGPTTKPVIETAGRPSLLAQPAITASVATSPAKGRL